MFNTLIFLAFLGREQPPSGGCVLKPIVSCMCCNETMAAAFGRLCVETSLIKWAIYSGAAAAFGRLCVETSYQSKQQIIDPAAAFGRLCVETGGYMKLIEYLAGSRLRAAVC